MIPLLAAAVLLGGLRDPRLAAVGEAAVFVLAWRRRPALGPTRGWLPWIAWAFLSAMVSLQPFACVQVLARWSAVLAFFSLAAQWSQVERERWLKAMLILSGILAVAAIWTGAGSGFRATMTGLLPPYYNYTTFALSAGVAAAAAGALHPRLQSPRLRLAMVAAAVLGGACLLLAHGRAAILSVLVAALVWAARRWGVKIGLLLAFAAGLMGVVFHVPLRSYLSHHGGLYHDVRLEIWDRAATVANEHPFLGVGGGSFGAAFRLHPVEARGGAARWGMNTDYAHSEILQAAAETGWVGLALWVVGLGASLSFLLRRSSDEPAREAAAIASVAMSAHLLVDNMLQLPGLAMLFFSSLAVAGGQSATGPRWPRSAIVAGMLIAAIGWAPRTMADGDPAIAAVIYPQEAYPREDLAYRAMQSGDFSRADAFWAQAEERAPLNAVYPWRRAQIAAAQGRWSAAEECARRGIDAEPGFLNLRVLRADALRHLGRVKDARDELAAVKKALGDRGERAGSSQYDATVWDFDAREFDRVSAAARR